MLYTTNALGQITSFGYDADNRQSKEIDAQGTTIARTTTTTYDAVGNVLSTTNAVGVTTSYAYDALNRKTQEIDAYGTGLAQTITTVYDGAGNVLSVTNGRGLTTSYGYDADNRQTTETDDYGDSLARTITTVYDKDSNVLSVTNGLGQVTSYGYDSLNRKTTEIDAYGTGLARTISTSYDAAGNVTAQIDALGNATSFTYDALNRQVTTKTADGAVTTTVYDADNNVVNTIDALGNKTTLTYDVLNRKTTQTDALAAVTTWAYDALNNLTSLTDPDSNTTQWLYDSLNRQVQELDALNNAATYAYDAIDRMTGQTERNGNQISYAYDALNRNTGQTWKTASGSVNNVLTFTYDANGNLLTDSDNANPLGTATVYTSTMTYDNLDRQSTLKSPFATSLTFSYNGANNLTKTVDSLGGTVTQSFDGLNRLVSVQFSGNSATLREDFAYTSRDQRSSETRYSDVAGTTTIGSTSFTYNAVGQITNEQHLNGSGTNLANFTWTYDLDSRVTTEVLNGGVATTYTYNADSELTNDGVATYTYDSNGNRTMTGYTTGTGNEITSDGTWNFFYDKNGNLVQKTNISTSEQWLYTYNVGNQLVGVTDTTTGVQMQATYVYDAMGHRIEKDVWNNGGSTVTTRFAYDQGQVWADLTSGNALTTRYVLGDGVDEKLADVSSGGTVNWLLTDRMGSTRNVVNGSGTLIGTVAYDGFGTPTLTGTTPRQLYKGEDWDSEVDEYHGEGWNYGRDELNAATDQFNGQDSAMQGTNWSIGFGNNPTNELDPDGLESSGPGYNPFSRETANALYNPNYSWTPPKDYQGSGALRDGLAGPEQEMSPDGTLKIRYYLDASVTATTPVAEVAKNFEGKVPKPLFFNPRFVGAHISFSIVTPPPADANYEAVIVAFVYNAYYSGNLPNVTKQTLPTGTWQDDLNPPKLPTPTFRDDPGVVVPMADWWKYSQFDLRRSFAIGIAYISKDGKRILDKIQGSYEYTLNLAVNQEHAALHFVSGAAYGGGWGTLNADDTWVNLLNKSRSTPFQVVKTMKELEKGKP